MNSGPVILHWTTAVRPPGYIADIETTHGPSVVTNHTLEAQALIHYVNIHTTGYTRYAQIKQGDVILDFLGDAPIDDKPGLRFEIGGKIYIQKEGGDELAESWDVRCNGVAVTRTVLVTLLS